MEASQELSSDNKGNTDNKGVSPEVVELLPAEAPIGEPIVPDSNINSGTMNTGDTRIYSFNDSDIVSVIDNIPSFKGVFSNATEIREAFGTEEELNEEIKSNC